MINASKRAFVRSTILALVLGAAFLILMTGSSLYLVFKTQEAVSASAQSRSVRRATIDLLDAVQSAESSQRGYLLTGQDQFLLPFREAMINLPSRLSELKERLAGADPKIFGNDFDSLYEQIDRKIVEMRSTLEMSEKGDTASAIAVVRNEYGLKLMLDIRRRLGEIVSAADERTREDYAVQNRLADMLKVITIIGFAALLALLAAASHAISRFVRELQDAWVALDRANQSLELKVQERTKDLMLANQEIQRFAYIVTHDLRAPLVNIMGFTSELEAEIDTIRKEIEKAGLPEKDVALLLESANRDLPEAISFIRSSTQKMDSLINAILKISRDGQRTLNIQPIDLAALVRTATEAVQHQVSVTNGRISTDIRPMDIRSDRLSLEQILGNLLDNAVKYRQPDRELEVTVRAYPVAHAMFEMVVEDNGRGIAPEDHQRIFDLFRRANKQEQPGEGIGLAHLRSLVRNLGGEVTVHSSLGKGARFVVRLPRILVQRKE